MFFIDIVFIIKRFGLNDFFVDFVIVIEGFEDFVFFTNTHINNNTRVYVNLDKFKSIYRHHHDLINVINGFGKNRDASLNRHLKINLKKRVDGLNKE